VQSRFGAWRPWMMATAIVVLINGLFLLLALWTAWLPRERLDQRIRDAFTSGELIDDDWPWLESHRGFNQYHDCSVLQMISNGDDHRWAAAVGPLMYNRTKGETDRCATLRTLVTEGPNTASYLVYRYTRYWHGYNPLSAALLWVMDLRNVRRVLKLTVYAALALLVVATGLRQRRLLAVSASIALTGALFWGVPYFGQSLTHGPGDAFVILGIVGLLAWRERVRSLSMLVPLCAVYGAGVAYLEFLTGLLPTAAGLLVPTVYVIERLRPEPENEPARARRLALAALLAFAFGGLLTIGIKQALAVAIFGPGVLRTFAEYLHRYINPSPGAALKHFGDTWTSPKDPLLVSSFKAVEAVLSQGYVLAYGSHTGAIVLYAASVLAWVAAGFIAVRRRVRWAASDLLGFAAGGAIVLAWILAFQTHSTIHKWWMVRTLLVPLSFGWSALAWQLIAIRVPTRTSPT
jgi:hypothetical protein